MFIHNFAFKFRKVLHVNILYRSVTVGSNCKLAVFSPSVTLQPWETSEVLQDYKISRLTARLGISKILSGPKSDIRRGINTRRCSGQGKRKKEKERINSLCADAGHKMWWAGWQKRSFSADSLVSSGPKTTLWHPHTRAHWCLPDRMFCTSRALREGI